MLPEGTILLADDEETFASATQTLLQRTGYDCDTVADAREMAVALHKGNAYDLLVTDLNMPGNRVMEMVDKIQQQAQILPVIVVTGYPSLRTAIDSVRLHVFAYLIKPVPFADLLETIRKGMLFKKSS